MPPSGPVLAGVFSSPSMGKLVANASLDLDPESQLRLEGLHQSPVRGARLQLLSAVSSVFLSNPHTEHLAHSVYLAFAHPVSLPPWGGGIRGSSSRSLFRLPLPRCGCPLMPAPGLCTCLFPAGGPHSPVFLCTYFSFLSFLFYFVWAPYVMALNVGRWTVFPVHCSGVLLVVFRGTQSSHMQSNSAL